MKAGELRDFIDTLIKEGSLQEDAEVVMSIDAEGNGFNNLPPSNKFAENGYNIGKDDGSQLVLWAWDSVIV